MGRGSKIRVILGVSGLAFGRKRVFESGLVVLQCHPGMVCRVMREVGSELPDFMFEYSSDAVALVQCMGPVLAV